MIDQDACFHIKQNLVLHQKDVQAVFIRKDPPFDALYLQQMWLLDLISDQVFVTNASSGIRAVNEKIWVSQFPEWTPRTLLTSSKQKYLSFLEEHTKIIIKPTSGFGGQGVFKVSHGDNNAAVIFEMLTHNESDYVVVQEYIAAAEIGDKRVLLLNGDVLGSVLRVQEGADHRNNFFAGGKAHAVSLTEREALIIKNLKPKLLDLGLHFVGLDFIGETLIEVNVTSPTCLREMNQLYDSCLEQSVIDFVEQNVQNMILVNTSK